MPDARITRHFGPCAFDVSGIARFPEVQPRNTVTTHFQRYRDALTEGAWENGQKQHQCRDADVVFVHFPMHPLLARRDIFENGSLQYFEVALREIWQYLKRRRHKDRNAV